MPAIDIEGFLMHKVLSIKGQPELWRRGPPFPENNNVSSQQQS